MRNLNGGYVMLDLNDTNNIYSRAKNIIGSGKPVMVFDDPECYYADSISLNGDGDVVIIKGGKTININDANAVISEGSVSAPTMENIKDLAGNLRFVEGDITSDVEGFTLSYAKWSLSGTHLMIVIAGSVADTTVISANTILTEVTLPDYIKDKIYDVISGRIENKNVILYANDWTTQTMSVGLNKISNGINIILPAITLTATRSFRLQFDLLIDAE